MHEFGIMQEAADMAIARALESGAERIHVIRLRVGKLSGVVPEAMRFVHEVIVEGTIAEGSALEIEEAPIVCWCAVCAAEFDAPDARFLCPRCQAPSGEIRGGRELEIVNMEVS